MVGEGCGESGTARRKNGRARYRRVLRRCLCADTLRACRAAVFSGGEDGTDGCGTVGIKVARVFDLQKFIAARDNGAGGARLQQDRQQDAECDRCGEQACRQCDPKFLLAVPSGRSAVGIGSFLRGFCRVAKLEPYIFLYAFVGEDGGCLLR